MDMLVSAPPPTWLSPVDGLSLVGRKGYSTLDMARLWWSSARDAVGRDAALRGAHSFVLFVGYPRSGHGLLASLLDAHPDAVVAHELDALRFVHRPFSGRQILSLAAANAREFSRGGRRWSGYVFEVPGQWQGRVRTPLVVGDKKGARTTRRLAARPGLLRSLERRIQRPVHVIHSVRNPFDTIGARFARNTGADPDRLLDAQLGLYGAVARLRSGGLPCIDVRHEDVVAAPAAHIANLCRRLRLPAQDDHLAACAELVFDRPQRMRDYFPWTRRRIARVESMIQSTDFLTGYTRD